MTFRYGSVCSGIEAATAAWHHIGWQPAFFSEIEKFPCAVLQHHYPDVPLHGDFTTIRKNEYGAIDLLVGGTPCQSFSVAGLRGGLDDDRGNLALEFCRLAQREQPRWIVWENVPGVLSSNGGRDFGSILGALEDLGYGLAYRVLDAQYFGVAQRRRRVFVVGYLGDWRPAAAVLFERHSMSGHPAPRRRSREEVAGEAATGAGGSGSVGGVRPDLAGPLTAGMCKGPRGTEAVESGHVVTVGTLRTNRPGEGGVQGDFDHIVPVISPALNTQSGSHHAPDTKAYVAFSSNMSVPDYQTDGSTPTLKLGGHGGGNPPAVAFTKGDHGQDAGYDISPTLRKGGDGGGQQPAVAYGMTTEQTPKFAEDMALTLTKQSPTGGGQPQAVMVSTSTVRRLTPVECERLQGFPDNFTAIPWRKKCAEDCPDGPRYKALGNSMAVPVMRWIGDRIKLVDAICSPQTSVF